MKKVFLIITATLFVFAMLPVTASAQHAQVYVAHGIPGGDLGLPSDLPVDVAVNDACALKGFKFGEIVGPLRLEAGTYNIKISVADPDDPCSNDPVIEADVPIMAGECATIIAHLNTAGAPTASKFVNDVSGIANQKARVVLHHTANAPAVDLWMTRATMGLLDISWRVENFIPGDKVAIEIFPKSWRVYFAPWRLDLVVFKNLLPPLLAKNGYFIYAVGSVTNGTFTLIWQRIKGLE